MKKIAPAAIILLIPILSIASEIDKTDYTTITLTVSEGQLRIECKADQMILRSDGSQLMINPNISWRDYTLSADTLIYFGSNDDILKMIKETPEQDIDESTTFVFEGTVPKIIHENNDELSYEADAMTFVSDSGEIVLEGNVVINLGRSIIKTEKARIIVKQ